MHTQQYLPPPLASTVKLSLFTHAYSSPLSLAAKLHHVVQTILVMLTMAGLFPDRSCVYAHMHVCVYKTLGKCFYGRITINFSEFGFILLWNILITKKEIGREV